MSYYFYKPSIFIDLGLGDTRGRKPYTEKMEPMAPTPMPTITQDGVEVVWDESDEEAILLLLTTIMH